MKKKIILSSKLYFPNIGGVENSILKLSDVYSNDLDYDVEIITTDINNIDDASLPNYEVDSCKEVLRVRSNYFLLSPFLTFFNMVLQFRDSIKNKDLIEVVIVRHHFSGLAALVSGAKNIVYLVPGVVNYQNNNRNNVISLKSKFSRYINAKIQRFVLERCDKIFVFSNNMREQVIENSKVNYKKISICKPGIDSVKFNLPSFNEKLELRKKYKISEDVTIVLGMARFVKAKGYRDLIESFSFLNENYLLILVGDGPEYNEYMKVVKKLNLRNVLFFPPTSAPEDFYKLSDIFAMTSIYEPLGQTILEAQACGLPVIYYKNNSSIITASEEIVDKNFSQSVEYGKPHKLAYSIDKLTTHLNKSDSVKLSIDTINTYSWHELAKKLLR